MAILATGPDHSIGAVSIDNRRISNETEIFEKVIAKIPRT